MGVIDAIVPFVSELVGRYKGTVQYYQLSNEIDYLWNRSDWSTDDVLIHYFDTMINSIKSKDPTAKTIITCVADRESRITIDRACVPKFPFSSMRVGMRIKRHGLKLQFISSDYSLIVARDPKPNARHL